MSLRPQYHFRPGAIGIDAWDVRRLVRLSEALPVIEVALSALAEVDENWWYQHEGVPTVRSLVGHMRLVAAVDLRYPILLCADGRLMDGMHRVGRALLEGRDHLPARRFVVTPEPDFRNADPDALPYED